MLGVVCADGTIGFDPNTALGTCTGAGASGTTVRFIVPVTPAGETPNHHPVFTNDVIEIGGATWDPATATAAAAGDACDATTGLPIVAATPAGKDAVKQEIRIVSDGDDRETFTPAGKTVAPAGGPADLELHDGRQIRILVRGNFCDRHCAPTPT